MATKGKQIIWICADCRWEGKITELVNKSCPECGYYFILDLHFYIKEQLKKEE